MNSQSSENAAPDRQGEEEPHDSKPNTPFARIEAAARSIFRRFVPRRRPKCDVYMIGYPKVGNTWFQCMLRRAMMLHYGLSEEEMWHLFAHEGPVPRGVPAVIVTHHMPRYNSESYREMAIDTRAVAGKKLILLIRDPRDTLVSLFMDKHHRQVPPVFEGTLEKMISDETFGIEKYLKFYNLWYAARELPSASLLVRYEDLKRDPGPLVREALALVGMEDVSDDLLSEVLHFGSFNSMRRMEQTGATPLGTLKKSSNDHPEALKTRKGIVGGYKDYLTAETVAAIDRRVEHDLPAAYGYHHHAD